MKACEREPRGLLDRPLVLAGTLTEANAHSGYTECRALEQIPSRLARIDENVLSMSLVALLMHENPPPRRGYILKECLVVARSE